MLYYAVNAKGQENLKKLQLWFITSRSKNLGEGLFSI